MIANQQYPRRGWPINEFGFPEVPSVALSLSDVPVAETADWIAVVEFALTFDGYSHWGALEKCAEFANGCLAAWRESGTLPGALDELRSCLFFEQRRWRHFQRHPDATAIAYMRAILKDIGADLKMIQFD